MSLFNIIDTGLPALTWTNLNVNNIRARAINFLNAVITGTLNVTGLTTLTTMNVSGFSRFLDEVETQRLGVLGNTNLNTLTAAGNSLFEGNLTVGNLGTVTIHASNTFVNGLLTPYFINISQNAPNNPPYDERGIQLGGIVFPDLKHRLNFMVFYESPAANLIFKDPMQMFYQKIGRHVTISFISSQIGAMIIAATGTDNIVLNAANLGADFLAQLTHDLTFYANDASDVNSISGTTVAALGGPSSTARVKITLNTAHPRIEFRRPDNTQMQTNDEIYNFSISFITNKEGSP